MNSIYRTLAVTLLALLVGCAAPPVTDADRIQITEADARFDVTVPKSRLVLSFPRQSLRQAFGDRRGAAASPRYFMVASPSGLVISGWFEPASRQGDLRSSWETEMAGLRRSGFGAPESVVETTINGMATILYNIPVPKGSSAHARCSLVRSGTWVDLHVSVSKDLPASAAREELIGVLNSLQFTDKPQ